MKQLVFAALFLAQGASAQVLTGVYGIADENDVCYPYPDGQLEVRATEIAFYESLCGLSNPRLLPGMGTAVQYTLSCSGEGTTWQDEVVLMQRDDGGLIMMRPGFVFEYQACK